MDCPVDDVLVLPPPTKQIRCKNNIVGTDNSTGIASEKINVANFPVANYASVSAASQTLMNESSNNENAADDNGCGNYDDRKLPLKCVIMTSILKGDDNDKEGGIEAFLSMYGDKENISGGATTITDLMTRWSLRMLEKMSALQLVRGNMITALPMVPVKMSTLKMVREKMRMSMMLSMVVERRVPQLNDEK